MADLSLLAALAIDQVRARKLSATQRLLGATIAISDEDWQEPSLLPGWTRAHVATHIARNADFLRQLVTTQGEHDAVSYGPEREMAIERGSERSALDLQIDLDTSAGQLNDCFDEVEDDGWDLPVTLPDGWEVPISALPMLRLYEVELHHVDLGIGYVVDDIDDETAGWLLSWKSVQLDHRAAQPMTLACTDGLELEIGDAGPRVRGSRQELLGWLTGRSDARPAGSETIPVEET